MPGATDVRSFHSRLNAGRVVRKGQKGIKIVAPVMGDDGKLSRSVAEVAGDRASLRGSHAGSMSAGAARKAVAIENMMIPAPASAAGSRCRLRAT